MNDEQTHLDLFSGIGGFAIAAGWAGYRTVAFCEQDDYCTKVLKRHWPDVPVIPDIRDFDGSKWRGAGLLTGGFPCQPFSQAGNQQGEQDDRHLWPEMFRVIKEARPDFVLAENVAGLINMALDDVLSDLEGEGYTTGAVVLPACALNAPHRRDRVWIMAHADIIGLERGIEGVSETHGQGHDKKDMSTRELQEHRWGDGLSTPRVSGGNDGVSDRSHRIKALGNAIVPQVAYEILKLTREITQQREEL